MYMPCKSVNDYSDEFADVLACITNTICNFPNCDIVIGGDFNCKFTPSNTQITH